MSVDVKYSTTVKVTGGREGHAAATDGSLDLVLSRPKELGGQGGPGTNPEQLFAAGYAACFIGALGVVAAQDKDKLPADTSITSTVGLGARSEGGFGIAVTLAVSLPGVAHEKAMSLVERAHQICPYSNATRGNVPVELKVV